MKQKGFIGLAAIGAFIVAHWLTAAIIGGTIVGGALWAGALMMDGSQVGGQIDLINYMQGANVKTITFGNLSAEQQANILSKTGLMIDPSSSFKIVPVPKEVLFDVDEYGGKTVKDKENSDSHFEVLLGHESFFTIFAIGYSDPVFGWSRHEFQVLPNPELSEVQPDPAMANTFSSAREFTAMGGSLNGIMELNSEPKLERIFPINDDLIVIIGPTNNEQWVSGDDDIAMEGFFVLMNSKLYLRILALKNQFYAAARSKDALSQLDNLFKSLRAERDPEAANPAIVTIETRPYSEDPLQVVIKYATSPAVPFENAIDVKKNDQLISYCTTAQLVDSATNVLKGRCDYRLRPNLFYWFSYAYPGGQYEEARAGPIFLTPGQTIALSLASKSKTKVSLALRNIGGVAQKINAAAAEVYGRTTTFTSQDIANYLKLEIEGNEKQAIFSEQDDVIIIPEVQSGDKIRYTISIPNFPSIDGVVTVEPGSFEVINFPYAAGSSVGGINLAGAISIPWRNAGYTASLAEKNFILYGDGLIHPLLKIRYTTDKATIRQAEVELAKSPDPAVSRNLAIPENLQKGDAVLDLREFGVKVGDYSVKASFRDDAVYAAEPFTINAGTINVRQASQEEEEQRKKGEGPGMFVSQADLSLSFGSVDGYIDNQLIEIVALPNQVRNTGEVPIGDATGIALGIEGLDTSKDLYLGISKVGSGEFGCASVESYTTVEGRRAFSGSTEGMSVMKAAGTTVLEKLKSAGGSVGDYFKGLSVDKVFNSIGSGTKYVFDKSKSAWASTVAGFKGQGVSGEANPTAAADDIGNTTLIQNSDATKSQIFVEGGELYSGRIYPVNHRLFSESPFPKSDWLVLRIDGSALTDMDGKSLKFIACQFDDDTQAIREAYLNINFKKGTVTPKTGYIQIVFPPEDIKKQYEADGISMDRIAEAITVKDSAGAVIATKANGNILVNKDQTKFIVQNLSYGNTYTITIDFARADYPPVQGKIVIASKDKEKDLIGGSYSG